MLWNDLRYALRLMRRSPGFTAVAVLSLGLGIGANTAIYSLFYTIMLRPLPVSHPEQLVELVRDTPTERHWPGYWSWDQYAYFRDHSHSFSELTGMGFDNLAWIRPDGSNGETLIEESVAANYFQVLGLEPAIGRTFRPEDEPAKGDGDVAVLSWSYWQRRYHGDPTVLGKRIYYNDDPKTIIGVAPQGYVGPRVGSRTDLWLPAGQFGLIMIARLKPGVRIGQAQAEIQVLQVTGTRQNVLRKNARMELLPAGAGLIRVQDQYGKPLLFLLAVVGLLLLLACTNMAGMLLARSAGRQHELSVRVGLGATRTRLVRQMLTEAVLLSSAGAAAGVALAWFFVAALVRILASSRDFEHIDVEVHPDLNVLAFTVAIALVTGILFGLAPAWHAFRSAPALGMRQPGRGGDTRTWRLFGKSLVAAQVALSILLVAAAALFLGHLSRLRHFDLGFRSDHVLLVKLDQSHTGYRPEQLAAPYRELLARMEALPGVRSASITACAPLEGCGSGGRYLIAEGHMERPEERRFTAIVFAAPRYFETLGIPLMAGRDFSFRDVGRPRVAILNQAAARRYFPGENPVGKYVQIDRDPKTGGWFGGDQPYEIIAMVGDIKAVELREPPYPSIYFNMFQESRIASEFQLHTTESPESLAGPVRLLVGNVMKGVPIKHLTTMEAQVDSNIVPERLVAMLSEYFGALAVVLAGIGLYGLLAYSVARRTNEIGVRMALGAASKDIAWLILRDALAMVSVGLALGAALVAWSLPLAARVFTDLHTDAAWPLLLGAAVIVAAAFAASLMPARRAMRLDPWVALRQD